MKIKQTIQVLVIVFLSFFAVLAFPQVSNADNDGKEKACATQLDANGNCVTTGTTNNSAATNNTQTSKTENQCGVNSKGEPIKTSIIGCEGDDGIWSLLELAINIMTAGVGIVAVGGIVWGSILYASAGGNPEQVKQAITIIKNVVIGLFMYFLAYAALNYLIPGGIFNSSGNNTDDSVKASIFNSPIAGGVDLATKGEKC